MFLIKLANLMENFSVKIKKDLCEKHYKRFLKEYNFIDGEYKEKKCINYNSYEGTNVFLIDELIKSGEILPENNILDIGCGAGIFMLYLAQNGFKHLYGYEIDQDLVSIANANISNLNGNKGTISVLRCDATKQEIPIYIDCIYMFNTFYDKETYKRVLDNIEKSYYKKERKIKIIILFPTVGSMGAMRESKIFKEKGRIFCDKVVCKRCVNFIIYETL